MKRTLGVVAFVLAVALLGLTLFNASWLAPTPTGAIRLIAQGGVAQQLARVGTDADCTASRIEPPVHDRLANTVRSIEDAIGQGANMVQVDVTSTSDGQIALFEDAALDCRTNGRGKTQDLTLAQLKALDNGYGYTADGGKTFPLRGQRKYPIPSLQEALWASGGTPLLFNLTGSDPAQADLLAAALRTAGRDVAKAGDAFTGDPRTVERIRALFPKNWAWSKDSAAACTDQYKTQGWFGTVPEACRNGTLIVPLDGQWAIPGWPNRALDRIKAVNAHVLIAGPKGEGQPTGLDLPEQLGQVPSSYKGYVWVEDIWTVGPALRSGRDRRSREQLEAAEKGLEARRAGR